MATKKKPAGKAARKVEWTRNRGKQPVADGVWVEVRLRNGTTNRGAAGGYEWRIDGKAMVAGDVDIMAWRRVRKPRLPKAEPVRHFDREDEMPRSMTGLSPTPATESLRRSEERFLQANARLRGTLDEFDAAVGKMREDADRLWQTAQDIGREQAPSGQHHAAQGEPVTFTMTAQHPLVDQLDPTTPARPVCDEHIDGDRDGLGCARGLVWSVVAILAVALLAVILRGCM